MLRRFLTKKQHNHRILSLLSVSALTASLLVSTAFAGNMNNFQKQKTYDGRFQDIDGWYTEYVITAYESDLFSGTSDTQYSPNSTVQLSAAVTLAARMNMQYNKGKAEFDAPGEGEAWYKPYYDYCVTKKLFDAKDIPYENMTNAATRNQVLQIFDKVLPDKEMKAINTVEDNAIPDVPMSDPYADVIYKFYRAGILAGDSAHKFNGNTSILRSELAVIVTRIAGLYPRSNVTLTNAQEQPAPEKPQETVDLSQYKDRTDVVVVDGKAYYIGMSESELLAAAGEPAYKLQSIRTGNTWYAYCDADYESVFLAGVTNGKVLSMCAAGSKFSYTGLTAGDTLKSPASTYTYGDYTYMSCGLFDLENKLSGVYLVESKEANLGALSFTTDRVGQECVAATLLINACRRMEGLEPYSVNTDACIMVSYYQSLKNEGKAVDMGDLLDMLREVGINIGGSRISSPSEENMWADCFWIVRDLLKRDGYRDNPADGWTTNTEYEWFALGCVPYRDEAGNAHFMWCKLLYNLAE